MPWGLRSATNAHTMSGKDKNSHSQDPEKISKLLNSLNPSKSPQPAKKPLPAGKPMPVGPRLSDADLKKGAEEPWERERDAREKREKDARLKETMEKASSAIEKFYKSSGGERGEEK